MISAIAEARLGLRPRWRRAVLTGFGIALAAAMLAAALVVGDGLGGGFGRAAKAAHLADVIVRFNPRPADQVAQRIAQLPDLRTFSLRQEVTNVELDANGHDTTNAVAQLIGTGRRGYAIVGGRDLSSRPGEVVVDRGFAAAWGLRLGEALSVAGLDQPSRIVGFAEEPDNVAYPLATPQFYLSQAALGEGADPQVNEAQIWLRDPRYLNEVLVQARADSYGLQGLRFITRSGVRVLLDQAAGIVIDLLVALSVIALATAGVMLAASARAEVQRRLGAIGIKRAVGASRARLALTQALEALLVALPAATIGTVAGALATAGPTDRLLMMLNEPPAGAGLLLPLVAGWGAAITIPALAAAWPAWRASSRHPIELLRGAELRAANSRTLVGSRWTGLTVLGGRLVGARRVRWAATALTLGLSTAFVLLMLALASALTSLETDPQELGKRYPLAASLPASAVPRVRRIDGVQAAAPRYEEEAVDSFSLGETIDVIAYPGDHTSFEAPPLAAGHRLRGDDQAEVGVGLADALGLSPGSPLAIQLDSGSELRLKVAGLVSSLDHDGRIAYVPAAALLAADPQAPEQLAVRLYPSANVANVSRALGPSAAPAAGATARGVPLVNTLRAILTAVAVLDGLVCLYALLQACALTVQERRRTIAVLRAFGGGGAAVRRLLAGAVIALLAPAAALGIVLEQLVLAPALSGLAASYAALPISASGAEIAAVVAGTAAAGAIAVMWVARQIGRETVVAGLTAT